jgi:uncharacterized protein YbaR (Trm112 family)
MDDTFLTHLRCPIDPTRTTPLVRRDHELQCTQCLVAFPIKQGLPILVPGEAHYPTGIRDLTQLPCRRNTNRSAGSSRK